MSNNNNNEITLFAETNFRNQRQKFGIKKADRRKHTYVIGKTGMGKTTLLENMAIQDIVAGRGIGIVDPHGEFAEKMLEFIPESRKNDVIYFNPSDTHYPIAFNPMEQVEAGQRHLVASGLLGVFKKIWPDVWSPRMEYLLSNAILALLEIPGSTLLGINRMFAEKEFRKQIVSSLADPVVKAFWEKEYAQYQERFATEASAAIQNKVGQFISNPLIRNIIGQKESAFNIRKIMDEEKILIMNLSKGKIGEENSRLLGAMLVTKIYLTAMTRVDIPQEENRRDFYLYVDEFQNFATESFASILSEARKYRLNLTLAHQYIAQMDETVQDAVFGNVGSMVTFRVGAQDAELLEKEYSPEFTIQDLVNLGFAQIYLKLMIDGVASRPFSATTLAPYPRPPRSFKEEIVNRSQAKYGMKHLEVQESINQYFNDGKKEAPKNAGATGGETRKEEFREERSEPKRKLFEAKCVVDGKTVLVPFEPDGRRPVYCQEHLEMLKSGELEPAPPPRPRRAENAGWRPSEPREPRPRSREPAAVSRTAPVAGAVRERSPEPRPAVFRDLRQGEYRSAPDLRRPEPRRNTEPGHNFERPKITSAPVVRSAEGAKPMSLSDLFVKKEKAAGTVVSGVRPKEREVAKKEVNVLELKSLLKDALEEEKKEKVLEPQVSGKKESQPEQKKTFGVIKPGESVKF